MAMSMSEVNEFYVEITKLMVVFQLTLGKVLCNNLNTVTTYLAASYPPINNCMSSIHQEKLWIKIVKISILKIVSMDCTINLHRCKFGPSF